MENNDLVFGEYADLSETLQEKWKLEPPLLTLTKVLGSIKLLYKSKLNIDFGYSLGNFDKDLMTLANFSTDHAEIKKIKTKTIGSSNVRYATAGNITKSLLKNIEDQPNNIPEGPDKDLKVLLKILPQELEKFEIELNETCFYKTTPNISATPDGKCLIGGIVCPVEVYATNEARTEFKQAITKNLSKKRADAKKLDKEIKKTTALIDLKRKQRNKKRSESEESFSQKNRSNIREKLKKEQTLINLSLKSLHEKLEHSFENRSLSQSSRRYIEHLTFVSEPINKEFDRVKWSQVQAEMFCMNAPFALAIYWDKNGIRYSISKYDNSFLMCRLSGVSFELFSS